MEKSSDARVCEVAEFTIIEELCDEFTDNVLFGVLMKESRQAVKNVRRYIAGP